MPHSSKRTLHQAPQAGFTMIEVLVAIVILSFGMLGLAGLQLNTLKNSRGAALRTLAIQHAYDMADRMRANLSGVAVGNYNMTSASAGTQTAACLTTAGCTPAQMAAHDIYEWQRNLSATTNTSGSGLPFGMGVVCIDNTASPPGVPSAPQCDNTGLIYRIKIWYLDDTANASLGEAGLKLIVVDFQV